MGELDFCIELDQLAGYRFNVRFVAAAISVSVHVVDAAGVQLHARPHGDEPALEELAP